MSESQVPLRWSPAAELLHEGGRPLLELLEPLARDRATSSADLAREASRTISAWLVAHEDELDGPRLRAELLPALAALERAHGWRGPLRCWLDVLGALVAPGGRLAPGAAPAEALHEELGLWLALHGEPSSEGRWSREPLAAGRRLPDRALAAAHAAASVEQGECLMTLGFSDTVARAIEVASGGGRRPRLLVGEGAGDRAGLVLARRIARSGVEVSVAYDASLFESMPLADRLWLGTEAMDAAGFLGRTGTAALCREARRLGVPVELLATSDKRVVGPATPPAWSADDRWLLWEEAPADVRVESQMYERVPLELADALVDETGRRDVAAPSNRRLLSIDV